MEPHQRPLKHMHDVDRTDRRRLNLESRHRDDRLPKRHAPSLNVEMFKDQNAMNAVAPYGGSVPNPNHAQPLPPTMMHHDRYSQIALDNSLDINKLRLAWGGSHPDVRSQLFDAATGVPLFILSLDIWRPLIRAYFSWYNIPRERCTDVWADIIDMFLRLPNHHTVDAEFRAWAFGCLGMFYLEDRQRMRKEEQCRAPPPPPRMHQHQQQQRTTLDDGGDFRSPTSPPPPRSDVYDPESNWMQTATPLK